MFSAIMQGFFRRRLHRSRETALTQRRQVIAIAQQDHTVVDPSYFAPVKLHNRDRLVSATKLRHQLRPPTPTAARVKLSDRTYRKYSDGSLRLEIQIS